jgi:hypothetical protein
MERCKRCEGTGRVPGLLWPTRRCPRCRQWRWVSGAGLVPDAATARMLRRMRRDWDYKQRVANARPKVALKHDGKPVR